MKLRISELGDFSREVIHVNYDSVPATWLGLTPIRHWSRRSAWTKGRAKHQLQVTPRKHRKIGTGLLLDSKTEIFCVKRDCWIEIVNHVSHSYCGHNRCLSGISHRTPFRCFSRCRGI